LKAEHWRQGVIIGMLVAQGCARTTQTLEKDAVVSSSSVAPAAATLQVSGQVINDLTGQPVPNVLVSAWQQFPRSTALEASGMRHAVADAGGRFQLSGLQPGLLQLRASNGEFVTSSTVWWPLLESTAAELRSLRVSPARRISGMLSSLDGASAVAGVLVVAENLEAGQVSAAEAPSRADGSFQIAGLPAGQYVLKLEYAPGLWLDTDRIVDVGDDDLQLGTAIRVPAGHALSGKLVPPVAARVELHYAYSLAEARRISARMLRSSVVAARDGSFTFPNVPPGEYRLFASSEDGLLGRATLLMQDTESGSVVVQLTPGASTFGRVEDDRGRPVSNGWVVVRSKPARATASDADGSKQLDPGFEGRSRRVRLGEDGRFALLGVEHGRYRFLVEDEHGGAMHAWRPADDRPSTKARSPFEEAFEANLDGPFALDGVRLVVSRCDAVATGTVATSLGEPMPNIRVFAKPEAAPATHDGGATGSAPPLEAVSDATGRFTLTGLCAVSYRAEAMSTAAPLQYGRSAPFVAGDSVQIAIGELSNLTVRASAAGRPVARYSIALAGPTPRREGSRDAEGRHEVKALPAGSYTVSLKSAVGYAVDTVAVGSSATPAELALELKPWRAIRGRVLSLVDEPLAGIRVKLQSRSFDCLDESGESRGRSRQTRVVLTEADGRFEFGGLCTGKGYVDVELPEGSRIAQTRSMPTPFGTVAIAGVEVQVNDTEDLQLAPFVVNSFH